METATYISRRQHRVTFRNGDTRRQVTVRLAKDADVAAIVEVARTEHAIGNAWREESIELLRISDKSVQRTTLV